MKFKVGQEVKVNLTKLNENLKIEGESLENMLTENSMKVLKNKSSCFKIKEVDKYGTPYLLTCEDLLIGWFNENELTGKDDG